MLLLTLRGTPTLYYGDEIGMTGVDIPPDKQQDPWGIRVPGMGRDPCRTPMQWNGSKHAGFSPPETRETWLPLGANYRTINVNSQLLDPQSVLNLYRKLLAYRNSSPSLQVGDYTPLDEVPQECFVFFRQEKGFPTNLVALNFSPMETHINLEQLGEGELILSTYLDRDGLINLNQLNLRGGEAVLIEIQSRSSNAPHPSEEVIN